MKMQLIKSVCQQIEEHGSFACRPDVAAEAKRGSQCMQASHLRSLAPHVLPHGLLPLLPMVPRHA